MINILPPELKAQIEYAKHNVVAWHYFLSLMVIALVVGAALWLSHWYANEQIAEYEQALTQAEQDISRFKELEESVSAMNSQLRAVESVLGQRPPFSVLLQDLAEVLPAGSYINGISLSEDIDQPLQLTVSTASRSQAVALRDAIVLSPHIDSADIQSIGTTRDDGRINVSIVMAFVIEEAP